MWDEIAPDAQAARTRQQLYQPVSLAPADADTGIFTNFLPGAGTYFMRGMAEAGRAIDMAGAVFPVIADKITGGTERQEQYFREHDEVFNSAVDYWTPKPGEVGAAGQVLGSVSSGIVQFMASPALAVSTAQIGTSEDLVRQGVDSGAALVAGDISALGTVAGIKLPILGNTLSQRIATGVAGNVGQGMAQAGATYAILKSAGVPDAITAQFDPLDARARAIDALMGATFGVAAHLGDVAQSRKDAITVLNQARHLEEASLPGRPVTEADLTKAVGATRQAIDQMLRGEPVAVDEAARGVSFEDSPARAADRAATADIVAEHASQLGKPISLPEMKSVDTAPPREGAPADTGAPRAPQFDESVRVPTGEFDAKTGEPVTVSANTFIAAANDALQKAKTNDVSLLRTAAACLLGSL